MSPERERVSCGTPQCQLTFQPLPENLTTECALAVLRNSLPRKEIGQACTTAAANGNQSRYEWLPLWLPLRRAKKACRDRQAISVTAHFMR